MAKENSNEANISFESELWCAVNILRSNMDAAEYKHIALRLSFANPYFNDSDWRGELLKDGKRWVFVVPPAGNANFAGEQYS